MNCFGFFTDYLILTTDYFSDYFPNNCRTSVKCPATAAAAAMAGLTRWVRPPGP
jgi:hypothetical protein